MKRTVWKWGLPLDVSFTLDMPAGAEVLTIQNQHDMPMLWALVDPDAPTEVRCFQTVGTGALEVEDGHYVGTIQVQGGAFVFHIFEVTA